MSTPGQPEPSSLPPADLLEARRWFAEADEELLIAQVLVTDERVPARAACFHAHLAAEKGLKALVIVRGRPIPRAHDLARLVQLLPVEDAEAFQLADLIALNPWTIEGRYPADLADIAAVAVDELVIAARRVVDVVRSRYFGQVGRS